MNCMFCLASASWFFLTHPVAFVSSALPLTKKLTVVGLQRMQIPYNLKVVTRRRAEDASEAQHPFFAVVTRKELLLRTATETASNRSPPGQLQPPFFTAITNSC